MGWEIDRDEAVPAHANMTCWTCKKKITEGAAAVLRRGKFEGKELSVSLHNTETCAGPVRPPIDDDAPAEPAKEETPVPSHELTAEQRVEHEHYLGIKDRTQRVLESLAAWQAAKDEAKARKESYDHLSGELITYIRDGADPQTKLPFPSDDATGADEPEWRGRPVSVLEIAAALAAKLIENQIATLGQLKDYWDAGKVLTSLQGIGPGKAQTIGDAFDDYGKLHPEVYGQPPAPGDDESNDDPFAGDDDGEGKAA